MGRVAEDEDALAGQVARIDRAAVPGEARGGVGEDRRGIGAGQRRDLLDETARRGKADGHGLDRGLPEAALQPLRGRAGDLRIEDHVEIGLAEPGDVAGRRIERRHDGDVDAEARQERADLRKIVAMAKAEGAGAENVAAWAGAGGPLGPGGSRGRRARSGEGAHDAVEGFRRAPVLLLLVGREFQRDHRDRQADGRSEPARVVLDQLGRAGRADEHGLRSEALIGAGDGVLEFLSGVAAEVARLERRVGDRCALAAALDHGEEQIGIGVALRRMQDVVDAFHRGGDPHRADMGWSLIGPDRELHGQTSSLSRRTRGRAKSSARSAACS